MSRTPNCTRPKNPVPGVCRYCGCVDADCRECVELTGEPCSWAAPSLCSACVTPELRRERQALRRQLAEMDAPLLAADAQEQAITDGCCRLVRDVLKIDKHKKRGRR